MDTMPRIPIEELKKDLVIKATLRGRDFTFHTTWGLFSPEKIDEGTSMLIESVELGEAKMLLDLGCGYGAIGIVLANEKPDLKVDMIDKDFVAVEYANKNAKLNGVQNTKAYLSNGFDQIPKEQKFDLIISNLPAKISKEYFWILFAEKLFMLCIIWAML